MKIKVWYLLFILAFTACGDDGNGSSSFYFSTYNGEAAFVNNSEYSPMPNATVKVYSSAQAWVEGQAPIKTFTTDSKGQYASNDVFDAGAVFYAEGMTYNNWPSFLSYESQIQDDGSISGSAVLYNTFKQDFESKSGKTYLLSDVLVDGVSIFANVSECSKDNYITITKDAKLIYSEGTNICSGKSQTVNYEIYVNEVVRTTEIYMNNYMTWQFTNNWSATSNLVYITKDFTKIMFKAWNDPGQPITVYTLQN